MPPQSQQNLVGFEMVEKVFDGASPYFQKEGQPVMLPSLVCFVDILGFSKQTTEAFKKGTAEVFLSRIRKALTSAYKSLRRDDELFRLLSSSPSYAVKVFTDNAVLGYPIPGFGSEEFKLADILQIFSEYQLCLASEGFLVRGGIAFGDLYMDEDIVFGEALIEAVKLDRKGGSPRICLAKSAIEFARKHIKEWTEINELLHDADGSVFLNYLDHSLFAFPDAFSPELIKNHRTTVINGLKEYINEPEIKAKFEWAARYHNFFCSETVSRSPIPTSECADPEWGAACVEIEKLNELLIDLENYASQPSRLKKLDGDYTS